VFVDDMERDCLRQGDILERIPFPLLATGSIRVLGKIKLEATELPYPSIDAALTPHRDDPNYFTGQLPMRLSFGAVVSHCCELEPRNGKLIGAMFTVARLVPVKQSIMRDSERLESLRANRDPREPIPGYLDYFYTTPHERLESKEWMVDFSQITSVPNSEFPAVLTQKVLQMDDRTRVKFKIKLATYLGRITDEEAENGLEQPWA
jgi:hypothetical protein